MRKRQHWGRGASDEPFVRDGREHHGGYRNNPWARANAEQGYREVEIEEEVPPDQHNPPGYPYASERYHEQDGWFGAQAARGAPFGRSIGEYGGQEGMSRASWRGQGWGGEQLGGGVGGPNYASPYMRPPPLRPTGGYGGQPRGMSSGSPPLHERPYGATPARPMMRGPHHGKGPKGYRRSDERIREDVCERLFDHDEVDASEIEVVVDNAEITLSGTASDRESKQLIERIAETVSGVHDIHNQIRVRRPGDVEAASADGGRQKLTAPAGNRNIGRS